MALTVLAAARAVHHALSPPASRSVCEGSSAWPVAPGSLSQELGGCGGGAREEWLFVQGGGQGMGASAQRRQLQGG